MDLRFLVRLAMLVDTLHCYFRGAKGDDEALVLRAFSIVHERDEMTKEMDVRGFRMLGYPELFSKRCNGIPIDADAFGDLQ